MCLRRVPISWPSQITNHKFTRVASHLFTGSLAGTIHISKLPALAGQYLVWYFCTVRFGGSFILWNFAETLFCKFAGNLFFPQKGGLVHQKGGRSLSLREKRGSCQMYDTKKSWPRFPLVSVGKIPGKYRPMPNRNTNSRCNSKIYNCESQTQMSFWYAPVLDLLLQNLTRYCNLWTYRIQRGHKHHRGISTTH